MEEATRDILSSPRGCLQERRGIHRPEEDLQGATVPIPQSSCPWIQERDDLPDKALQESREVHQWVLEATHILELNIERLSWEANRTKCQHSHSHSCAWGRLQERCAQSLSPHRPRRHVTFCEPEEGMSSDERPQREPWAQATRGR